MRDQSKSETSNFRITLNGKFRENAGATGPRREGQEQKDGYERDTFHLFCKNTQKKRPAKEAKVIELGFEPKTHSLEGCCSVQLSYGTKTAPVKVPTKILNFSVLRLSLPVSRAYPCSSG